MSKTSNTALSLPFSLSHTQGVLEMHAERLEDQVGEREELWKAIEGLRLAEPSDVTGFTEIDRARLTFGSGMPLVRRRNGGGAYSCCSLA